MLYESPKHIAQSVRISSIKVGYIWLLGNYLMEPLHVPYRAAINLDNGHDDKSPSINPAVAFALPTTPGIPAPGCVPAPTR